MAGGAVTTLSGGLAGDSFSAHLSGGLSLAFAIYISASVSGGLISLLHGWKSHIRLNKIDWFWFNLIHSSYCFFQYSVFKGKRWNSSCCYLNVALLLLPANITRMHPRGVSYSMRSRLSLKLHSLPIPYYWMVLVGHLNPAVTLAMCVHRRFEWRYFPGSLRWPLCLYQFRINKCLISEVVFFSFKSWAHLWLFFSFFFFFVFFVYARSFLGVFSNVFVRGFSTFTFLGLFHGLLNSSYLFSQSSVLFFRIHVLSLLLIVVLSW